MADWDFMLGDIVGGHDVGLSHVRSRSITFRLTEPGEASFDIDGRSPQALNIDELTKDLHCTRDGQELFRGRIGSVQDELGANEHRTSVTALDYREVLNRRLLFSDSTLTYEQLDQAEIAWRLILQTESRDGTIWHITPGEGSSTDEGNAYGGSTGRVRDRTYEAGKSIGEAIQQLSEVIDGFDWDITPRNERDMTLDIFYPRRGEDRGVVLEYGGSLVNSVRREVDPSEYANAIRIKGRDQDDGSDPTPVELTVVDENGDFDQRPEGRWDKEYTTDIVLQSTLEDRAQWQLDQAQALIPSYTVTLTEGAWGGPSHIWLGDMVQLVVFSGRLQVDFSYRVHEISIDIDESGAEHVELTLGGPKPDIRKVLPRVYRRLSTLEKR